MRLFVAALTALLVMPAFAQDYANDTGETRGGVNIDRQENANKSGDIGIGAMIGEPISVTGKYWLDEANAIDAGVAFANEDVGIVADYLYHFRGAFADRGDFMSNVAPYIGAGLIVSFDQEGGDGLLDGETLEDDQVGLGARIPLGLEWLPRTLPAGVFAELAPGLGIGDQDTFAFLQVGAGARFYF
jgi:hypothetical protein